MTCPHCQHVFPLTWARYLGAIFGKYTCPACEKHSRFRLTARYVFWMLGICLAYYGILLGVVILVTAERFDEVMTMPVVTVLLNGSLLLWFLLAAPFDKRYYERHRSLEPSRDDTHAA